MDIKELKHLSDAQIADLLVLMAELDPEIAVSPDMLRAAAADPATHLFAAVEGGRIAACATLCISQSPTGRKGAIEDVVVGSAFRGRGLGRMMMEHIIEYARQKHSPIVLHLTSRPAREAANRLYRAVGMHRYDTNVYKLKLHL